ncbi:MAG TPA: hypothetical protein VL357_03030 [Rariglobus sp.]|jgi:phage gpG-like protein|nr:hypothetical protein [Rariglobus sp.]
MAVDLQITLSPKAQALLANAQQFPMNLLKAVRTTLNYELGLAVGHIQKDRLTGKGPFPAADGRLGVRTNRLRQSVWQAPAQIAGNVITASIGSNVKYAAIHEYGGAFQVKAHKRRIIAFDRYERRGRGLVKTQSGIRGAIKSYTINFPARAPFRRGLEDRLPRIGQALSTAVVQAFNPPAGAAS